MDIPGLSTTLSQTGLVQKTSIAVLDKTMDLNEDLGDGLLRMIDAAAMEISVNPAVGGNFDVRV